jgi:general L-amino acid transport system substrate-binding protein
MYRYHQPPVSMSTFLAIVTVLAAMLGVASLAAAQPRDRVASIVERGYLSCGVWPEVRGFASVDQAGRYRGFDVDMCRAVAAAILGDPEAVRFVKLATVEEFIASREIDIVSRRLTWSLTREGVLGLRFGPVTFYDGQGFLVPKRLGIRRVSQLSRRRVCVDSGSPAEFNLGEVFRSRRLALEQVLIEPGTTIADAFARGQCDAYTADVSMLASIRAGFARPEQFDILDEQVSKEPLAQVVRQDDALLFDILRWTIFALINAEELGVTSANLAVMRSSANPEVQRLLGAEPGNGPALRLRESWAHDVIRAIGNYGELYERNVGAMTPLRLPRGLNRLWTSGGLMWAPPAR